jgi:hypothetical protein
MVDDYFSRTWEHAQLYRSSYHISYEKYIYSRFSDRMPDALGEYADDWIRHIKFFSFLLESA